MITASNTRIEVVSDPVDPQDAVNLRTLQTAVTTAVAGTLNRLAKFTSPNTVGDSQITDDGSAVDVSAATTASILAGTLASVTGGTGLTLKATTGDALVDAPNATGSALVNAGAPAVAPPDGVARVVGQLGAQIIATTGTVHAQALGAGGIALINAPDVAGTALVNAGAVPVIPGPGFAAIQGLNGSFVNGILNLGATSVAGLAAGIFVGLTPAVAFVTNMRNLDSGAAYPALQGAGLGSGGLAIRFTDGVWRLSGTNIVAVA